MGEMQDANASSTQEAYLGYLEFLVAFAIRPKRTMARYVPHDRPDRVSRRLMDFLVLSTAASAAIYNMHDRFGWPDDAGNVLGLLRVIDPTFWPLLLVAFFALVAVLLEAFDFFSRKMRGGGSQRIAGSPKDNISAMMGFTAAYLPLSTLLMLGAEWADHALPRAWAFPLRMVLLSVVAVAPFIYLQPAISALRPGFRIMDALSPIFLAIGWVAMWLWFQWSGVLFLLGAVVTLTAIPLSIGWIRRITGRGQDV